jgi:anti-anti-sigma regulatory factor
MKATEINLKEMIEFSPAEGKVKLGADRLLIFRQESFRVLRRLMYHQLGDTLTQALLSQFGFNCGHGDHLNLMKMQNWDSEMDKMACGPVIHTWEGIVLAQPTFLEFDRGTGHFHMKGTWDNSYEAEIHLQEFGKSSSPVCHTLTGYASGWCTAFFGASLIAIETKCVGKGDDRCEFEIRPPEKWGSEAEPWKKALAATDSSISAELEEKLKVINRQRDALRELSTPIIEIWDDILVLPIMGVVDTRRSLEIMDNLLAAIVKSQTKCVIIDITGVEIVDTRTADYLLKVVQAAQLLGARCVLTGINPAVAQTLVEIGADLSKVKTLRNLKAGLLDCLKHIRSGAVKISEE